MPDEDDLAELLELITAACDGLEGRLAAVEEEMSAPASRKDNANAPVQGGYQSPTDPTDCNEGDQWL
jgi:hypothetical protein